MAYERLSVEFDEEGWVTFCLADRPPAEQSRAEFQPPKGFTLDDVLEAARATGWVVDRQGSLWIDPGTTSGTMYPWSGSAGCTALANFVREMLYYFDAPNRPSQRLMRIKQAVDRWLAGENDDGTRFSLWVCAWLDLMVRDDAREDVLTAEDVWRSDSLRLDIGKHRERRLRQAWQRFQGQAQPTEEAEAAETGRRAPSQRSRRPAEQRRKEVG